MEKTGFENDFDNMDMTEFDDEQYISDEFDSEDFDSEDFGSTEDFGSEDFDDLDAADEIDTEDSEYYDISEYEIEGLEDEEINLDDDTEDEHAHENEVDDVGVTVDLRSSELNSDNTEKIIYTDEFINENGDLVVQDIGDNEDKFKLQYIDISNIAVVQRIRATKNVDSLLESVKSTGLLQPIVVAPTATDGIYVLIDGYRRIIACAKAGIRKIPCVINTKISIKDIPILEALYNHAKSYTIKEIVDYINYLEKEKGIFSASMIEYLLQLDSGDYTKLKDILEDDDEEIVTALMTGKMTIAQAFKKLEQRRKKESKEEQELKKVEKVYEEGTDSEVKNIQGAGEEADDTAVLSDEEIASLALNIEDLNNTENESLDSLAEEGNSIEGFEPNQQDYKHREILDPALRKSVLARDKNTCQCCGLSGQEYLDVFDVHHIVEVYLGGSDDIKNLITVCTVCHRLIHSFARGELFIRPESELSEDEALKFKKIVKLGNVIRRGMAVKRIKKEDLKKMDNAEKIGRTKPGTPKQQAS